MFIVIGILSILAGVFAFNQGSMLSALSNLARSEQGSVVSGGFLITAILMVLGGVFCCACAGGKKRGLVKASIVAYVLGFLAGLTAFVGDMQIYAVACAAVALILIIWIIRHKKEVTQNAEKQEG